MNADLIIFNIGQLITCRSNGKVKRGPEMRDIGIVDEGAVAIVGENVAAAGKSEEILSKYRANNAVDARGRVVCPGFVDPHTHIVYAGNRLDEFELKIGGVDYLEILARGGGIISTVKKTRAADLESLVTESGRRLDKMLAAGTTTCEIKTGYGLELETELKMLRAIEELDQSHPISVVPTFLAAHAVPPEYAGNSDEYVDLVCREMLPMAWEWYSASHFAAKGAPFFADVFVEKNAFDVEQSRHILEDAKRLGFALKAHVDEFTNLEGSDMALELGAASIDHLDAISDREISRLAASETVGIITPTVNFNFGSAHFADARKLIDSGCAIAIATDYNPGSAPCPSQPMSMAISCRYQKLLPAEAFSAATINAAISIGQGNTVGSLETGKRADLIIFDTKDYREIVYEFGQCTAADVYVAGKKVK
ncbi:MAG TPA: imidazolonepropionase [Blastocatellia bacterium]|nr:imidazolonepropionase [Blastocatellia bacterium]